MKKASFWIYILHCENDTFYTGYTTDLKRRYQEHLEGSPKCKYTRSFKPLSMVQCWRTTESKSTALKIEHYLKKITRLEKIKLIEQPKKLADLFACKPALRDLKT